MRFMMIVKASRDSEAGMPPSPDIVAAMSKFNQEMVNAGVLLAAEGLHASSRGVRIRFSAGQRTVTDGPFTESNELIAGFWLIQARSKEEALEWAFRCPPPYGADRDGEIEIREVIDRGVVRLALMD
jgi:hypothetical protein